MGIEERLEPIPIPSARRSSTDHGIQFVNRAVNRAQISIRMGRGRGSHQKGGVGNESGNTHLAILPAGGVHPLPLIVRLIGDGLGGDSDSLLGVGADLRR